MTEDEKHDYLTRRVEDCRMALVIDCHQKMLADAIKNFAQRKNTFSIVLDLRDYNKFSEEIRIVALGRMLEQDGMVSEIRWYTYDSRTKWLESATIWPTSEAYELHLTAQRARIKAKKDARAKRVKMIKSVVVGCAKFVAYFAAALGGASSVLYREQIVELFSHLY